MNQIVGEQLEDLLRLALSNDDHAVNQAVNRYGNNAHLCFNTVDWAKLRAETEDGDLKFCRVNWGRNFVDFAGCDFGDGDLTLTGSFNGGVSFAGAVFGEGDVSFAGSTFANADFSGSMFCGTGQVSFAGVTFLGKTQLNFKRLDHKEVYFGQLSLNHGRQLKDCQISGSSFSLVTGEFSGEKIDLCRARFEASLVMLNFSDASGLDTVDLSKTSWACETALIHGLKLKKGALNFTSAFLRDTEYFSIEDVSTEVGNLFFAQTVFPTNGICRFGFKDLGIGQVNFDYAQFAGSVEIEQGEDAVWSSVFSFRGATFEGPLRLDGLRFGPVPDLTGTEFRKHLSMSGLRFDVGNKKGLVDKGQRASKLQRLKELAEGNRDHNLALVCHAHEMRANRWQKNGASPWASYLLDLIYDLTSNYGQSIFRPCLLLFVSWILFGWYYGTLAVEDGATMVFSATTAVPFLTASGIFRSEEFKALFDNPSSDLYLMMGAQGLISFALLFLVGLGLRNRFRI
jgi:uncharacterized protein YjbI with pentapeptide repeats